MLPHGGVPARYGRDRIGSNIYPREVEEVLLTHPEVREAAVFGTPDPVWGESVVAVVVPESPGAVSADDLITHVRAHLASFKKPRIVTFVDDLPKNSVGKVLNRRLRGGQPPFEFGPRTAALPHSPRKNGPRGG